MAEPSSSSGIEKEVFEKYKIEFLVDNLDGHKDTKRALISLLVCPDEITNYINVLEKEMKKEKEKDSEDVLNNLASALKRLKLYNDKDNPNGVVVYKGKDLLIDFEPFKTITKSVFFIDTKFHTLELKTLFGIEGSTSKTGFGRAAKDA